MSLKDRLQNGKNKVANSLIENEQKELKYYESSEIANIQTLGIIDSLLIDDEINSIYVNGAKNIYIEKKKKTYKSTNTFRDNVQLENIIQKNAQNIGIEMDSKTPYIEFNYKDGVNIVATIPPLTSTGTIYIKCFQDKYASFEVLEKNKSVSKEISLFLKTLMSSNSNIIITGKKNTLKTTLLSALIKTMKTNERIAVIDLLHEIKTTNTNITSYDCSFTNDLELRKNIISSIFNSNPDKIFINDCKSDMLFLAAQKATDGYKGLVLNIVANSKEEAIEKIIIEILKNCPTLSYNCAKMMVYKQFDYIISTDADELGKRTVNSICEIDVNENIEYALQEIFKLDDIYKHNSTGFCPKIFKEGDLSKSINSNIFNSNYKHTYVEFNEVNIPHNFEKRSVNMEILKKFKKDLRSIEEVSVELDNASSSEDLMKKAQSKFDEIRKNAKIGNSIDLNNLEEAYSETEEASEIKDTNEITNEPNE